MKILVSMVFTALVASGCQATTNDSLAKALSADLPDRLSTHRVEFALDLKTDTAKHSWPELGIKTNEGTLIYYDGEQSEVFFADSQVSTRLTPTHKYSDNYWVTDRLDEWPMHMEVMISFNEADGDKYFYHNPVEQYSSVEEVGKTIGSVETTEMWATMVVHEMFHHFQYNTPEWVAYAKSTIGTLPYDIRNLVALANEDSDFLKMVQLENHMLLQAIGESDPGVRDDWVTIYLASRQARINKYKAEHPHLEQVENYYTIQEGSARYIEYQSMFVLNSRSQEASSPIVKGDPRFKAYSEFKTISLDSDEFNYLVYAGPTDYHYTIGFNTMRLLDVLGVEYKKTLLKTPEKALYQYLKD